MSKTHFKMYKAGTKWLIAGITTVAAGAILAGGGTPLMAHASTQTPVVQSQQSGAVQSSAPSSAASASSSIASSATSSANSSVASSAGSSSASSATSSANSSTATSANSSSASSATSSANSSASSSAASSANNSSAAQSGSQEDPNNGYTDVISHNGDGSIGHDVFVKDPKNPNLVTYYYFDSDSEPYCQYSFNTAVRIISISSPHPSTFPVQMQRVKFNRWIAINTATGELVGFGPWVPEAGSDGSIPAYKIPQITGYMSYYNDQPAKVVNTITYQEIKNSASFGATFSGSVTYRKMSVTKTEQQHKIVRRTINIKTPDNKTQTDTQSVDYVRTISTYEDGSQVQSAWKLAENNAANWPTYAVPQIAGYDSCVNGQKATSIDSQAVTEASNDVTVEVTYQKQPVKSQEQRVITRTIQITNPDGQKGIQPQFVTFVRDVTTNADGTKIYGDWTLDSKSNKDWPTYAIPQIAGYDSYVNGQKVTSIDSQAVTDASKDVTVAVTYQKQPVKSQEYKTVTRTIQTIDQNGKKSSQTQTVQFVRDVTTNADGTKAYGNWTLDSKSNKNWPVFNIPQIAGYDSYVNGQKATTISFQDVADNSKDVTIQVTYQKQPIKSQEHKAITRTIQITNLNGQKSSQTQTVTYVRDVTTSADGTKTYGNWTLDGESSNNWPAYNVPQIAGYESYVDGQLSQTVASKAVSLNDDNLTVNVTYKQVAPTHVANGWQKTDGHWYYYVNNNPQTGWQMYNNNWYYFDNNGQAASGLQTINGRTYYFDANNAWALKGWQHVNGSWYYFDPSNVWAQTGWFRTGAGNWYYFDQNGKATSGLRMINGRTYYFDPNNAWAVKGWQHINGSWYFFDTNNTWALTGWQRLNNRWYYFGQNGAAETGWQYINGQWYYMDPTNAWMQTGWQLVGNTWYYLNGSGAMTTGWQYINNRWYYMNGSGAMLTGWQWINGRWYYLNGSGAMTTGWQYINNRWYYMNGSGAMLTGWQWINGSWYYLTGSGAMATGWIYLNGQWYYLSGSGAMVTGSQNINGRNYNFDGSGHWIA